MSSSHQLHTYLTRDFTPSQRRVAAYIERHPGCTRADIAAALPAGQKSSISGRVGDLKALGCLIIVDATGGEQLTFDPVRTNWPVRARELAKAKELKAFAEAAEYLKPYLPGPIVEELRHKYAELRATL